MCERSARVERNRNEAFAVLCLLCRLIDEDMQNYLFIKPTNLDRKVSASRSLEGKAVLLDA